MRFKNRALAAVSILLVFLTLLPSCTPTVEEVTAPEQTESLFPDETEAAQEDFIEIDYANCELPNVYITTDDGKQVTSKDVYSTCNIRMEMNGLYDEFQNTYTDENGAAAQIRCRGNMTYNIADVKKQNMYSYKLKLDVKTDLFGMGASKHWYLINCWRDTSYLRHKLAYDLSIAMGLYATESTWVNVYYNGEYRGLYLMTESIRIAKDRLEMTNWEEFAEDVGEAYAEDNQLDASDAEVLVNTMEHNLRWISTAKLTVNLPSGPRDIDFSAYFDPDELDLSTGYLIEICNGMDTDGAKWKTNAGFFIVLDSPMYLHTNSEMFKFVRELIQDFEDAVMSPTFYNSKGKHYSEYIDVDSMVDYWMVWNFFVNTEFGARSMYFYIEDGKIVFGPNWDFDGTSGNIMSTTATGGAYDKWANDRSGTWFKNVMRDPWFTAKCQERWFSMRELIDDFMQSMDMYALYIKAAAERCYEKTGPRLEIVRQPKVNDGHSFSPWEDYLYLKDWFENRIAWLDEHFSKIDPNIDKAGYERSSKIVNVLTLNGVRLEADKTKVHGLAADYVLPSNATGVLKLTVTTTHSGVTHGTAYLNDGQLISTQPLSSKQKAEFIIDIFSLDLNNGALNTIYIPAYREDGSMRSMTSVVIRISDEGNPDENECVVQLGNESVYATKNSSFVLPEVEEKREGFVCVGWQAEDGTVKAFGEEITVNENVYFFPKWKRTELFSVMEFFPE